MNRKIIEECLAAAILTVFALACWGWHQRLKEYEAMREPKVAKAESETQALQIHPEFPEIMQVEISRLKKDCSAHYFPDSNRTVESCIWEGR